MKRRWRLLAVLTAAYGAGAFGMLGLSPLVPSLVEGLRLTRLEVAFVIPTIYLGGLLFSLPGGRLADRLGARPALLGGLAVGGLGLGAAAAAASFPLFLLCLLVAGTGWGVVNPALGRAIMDLFPPGERGTAMGIKQMGLTLGGVAAALLLPAVAAAAGWRAAVAASALFVGLPVVLAWRPLGGLAGAPAGGRGPADPAAPAAGRAWTRRPALLVLFAGGLALGMVQAAVLTYLPLYATQGLGFDRIAAGLLVAASQAGGVVSRLALGAASDRWFAERRSIWLTGTAAVGAAVFLVYAIRPVSAPLAAGALAFAAGVGAYGWVGVFFVISAEAGGAGQAGLLSGVAFAAIVVGLLTGPVLFGLLLERWDSYPVAWTAFAALGVAVGATVLAAGPAIERERRRG